MVTARTASSLGGQLEGGQQVAPSCAFQAFSPLGRSSTIRSSPPFDAPRRSVDGVERGQIGGQAAV